LNPTLFARCPKTLHNFPPRKRGILLALWGFPGTSLPFPQSLYGQAAGVADVTTKFSRIDRLPNLFTNGAPLLCKILTQSLFRNTAYENNVTGVVNEEGTDSG